MLQKVANDTIGVAVRDVRLAPDLVLHVKTLSGPDQSGRTALFIHGGGAGGNHTLVERPARWLIDQGLFDTVILPDRRGNGGSSPLTRPTTMREQASDMKALLEAMGVVGPVSALGISYGGPIALTLAAQDPRIDLVGLVASSPTLKQLAQPLRFFMGSGILPAVTRGVLRRTVGRSSPADVDYDAAYDAARVRDLTPLFLAGMKSTPADRLDSLLLDYTSTLDPSNASIPEEVRLAIPVVQVIGERDEVWGSELPSAYVSRFPQLLRVVIPGAVHKDVFPRAAEFYEALASGVRDSRRASRGGESPA